MTDPERRAACAGLGLPAYRADQVREWLFHHWVTDPAAMTNLPRELRAILAREFRTGEVRPVATLRATDGTVKLLLQLADGEQLESVIIPAPNRLTFCLSTQVGCPIRCRFCASGSRGLVRNLEAGEIIEQLLACCREARRRPDNLVFMGIGEPLWNFRRLNLALDRICAPDGFAFAPRRITISTSGWTPGIRRLTRAGRQWHLALSLHATTDRLRAELIPEPRRRPLTEVLAACREYRAQTGRIVTFEYLLLSGINDRPADALALARLARQERAKINLIPFNPIPGLPYSRPDRETIRRFAATLAEHGATATLRREMGTDIQAACGQLRAAASATQPPPGAAPAQQEPKWNRTSPPSSRPSAKTPRAKGWPKRRRGSLKASRS